MSILASWGAAGGAGPEGTVRFSTGPESTVPPAASAGGGAGLCPAGAGGGQGGRKRKGPLFSAAPVPTPAVDLVEALTCRPLGRRRVARRPPRWLGGSRQVTGTRPYPLVPPLPVLEDFTTGPPPFRGRRNVAASGGRRKAPTLDRGAP